MAFFGACENTVALAGAFRQPIEIRIAYRSTTTTTPASWTTSTASSSVSIGRPAHEITPRLPGFETWSVEVYAVPGRTLNVHHDMPAGATEPEYGQYPYEEPSVGEGHADEDPDVE